MKLKIIFILFATSFAMRSQELNEEHLGYTQSKGFEEYKGRLSVEAEDFHYKSNNGTPREWQIVSFDSIGLDQINPISKALQTASGSVFIQSIPDTRVTHEDPLIQGENFFPDPGTGGIVSYRVKINTPGKYFVWVSAFSTGSEDNGLHVGLDGEWPETGARIQWCQGKGSWQWSNAQRTDSNHCGEPGLIYLVVEKAGDHMISFSMREDGFKMDRWMITIDPTFVPKQ
ncbi:MAG: hypothetical protein WBN28_03155 [Lutimonas sp.]